MSWKNGIEFNGVALYSSNAIQRIALAGNRRVAAATTAEEEFRHGGM
ncbi:hypothetical protein [Solimicrobium silvestre]|nr:hypothetical protein [Solimicrobium silvestre]